MSSITSHLVAALNCPDILQALLPGFSRVDNISFFDDPHNVAFGDERGVIACFYVGAGVYEWHYLLTSAIRGKDALHFAREVIHAMFTRHDARAIRGSTPRDNRAARIMNRALGAVPVGKSVDSFGRDCIDYLLDRDKWATFSKD